MSEDVKIDADGFRINVSQLVRLNLAFHNLNKTAEDKLGISLVQYHLLFTLRDLPGITPQKLARAMGMHPSTLTQSMKRLDRKKMIYVEEDPKDSRSKIIGLTMRGHEAIQGFKERFMSCVAPLDGEGFKLLRTGLSPLVSKL